MAKRTQLSEPKSNPRDYWDTPPEAARHLHMHLPPETRFVEPCAGAGALVQALQALGHKCAAAYDIEPRHPQVEACDALQAPNSKVQTYITNPPYSEELVKPLLDLWIQQGKTTWLLVPSDWLANLWFAPYAPHLHRVVPVGRLKWIKDSSGSGFENSVWICLDPSTGPHDFLAPRRSKNELNRRDRQIARDLLA